MENASQKASESNTSTKQDRWYLGEGISRIIDGDNSYLIVKVAEFPESQWEEWNKDCKLNFSNCRWAKMMNDHTKSKMIDLIVQNKFNVEQKKEETKKEYTLSGEEIA